MVQLKHTKVIDMENMIERVMMDMMDNHNYIDEALTSDKPDLKQTIIKVIRRGEIILDHWDDLAELDFGTRTRIGPMLFEVDTADGICSNACITSIGIDLKYLIFKTWSKFKIYDSNDPISSLIYPVASFAEYEKQENLFKNNDRKDLLIHVIKCLKEIKEVL